MILLGNEYWRVAGILEWIVCFIGAAWLGVFVGFLKYVFLDLVKYGGGIWCDFVLIFDRVPDEGIDVRERDPLLGEEAYLN